MVHLEVAPLKEHQDKFETCVAWWLNAWGYGMGFTEETGRDAVDALVRDGGEQTALIGLVDGKAAGSVFFIREDLQSHRHLTPWLAALYVLPACRRLGLGAALISAVVEHARNKGTERLYLYSSIGNFYRRFGWTTLETVERNGVPLEIMHLDLVARQSSAAM